MPPAARPENEALRLETLRECCILETGPEPAFDDLTRLAAELFGMPIASISMADERRQWVKSRVGIEIDEMDRDRGVCGYVILSDRPVVVPDMTKDPRTSDFEYVREAPRLRAYAGAPLIVSNGMALGSFCVAGYEPREFTEVEISHLEMLARQAASQLELRRTISKLRASEAAARQADVAKSRFLANMSHEIRTPLMAILGYAELLDLVSSADGAEKDVFSLRHAISRNAKHLQTLLNDILDLSKIEAGQLAVDREAVDPVSLVLGVFETYRGRLERKGLRGGVEWDGAFPREIRTDPVRVRQILINLLDNAVKFTNSGSVRVTCSCDRDLGLLRVRVADTGIGMTPEEIERIARFAPFTQVDESSTRMYGGSGLGLSIARHLAGLLGGSLEIDSVSGAGSEFFLRVGTGPLSGVRMLSPEEIAEIERGGVGPAGEPGPAETSGCGETPLAGVRVLIAEDGPDNVRLMRFFLERAGAVIRSVSNGRDALAEYVREPGVDLVLMDIQMPVMDGYDATRRLRGRGYGGPILAVTAHAMTEDRERCLEAGCSGYITKPISGKRLVERCAEALRARERSEKAA